MESLNLLLLKWEVWFHTVLLSLALPTAPPPLGQSGLGKSTMVNTLFKSKVSRKSACPAYEERIPKTVQLLSVAHGKGLTPCLF